eukprot:CAMPEP_0116055790 /NCGR_PEP_ID=MMETSP0322-20121206/3616_1 /TAXON_ID=163516 /ORGANISM="Leptocylindrus danicus var. apora, Strain B651" /LENGTH=36 /DNA_ID= /DNA_START= /DNA_END= /DNA_ORIENTATION=
MRKRDPKLPESIDLALYSGSFKSTSNYEGERQHVHA